MNCEDLVAAGAPELPDGFFYRVRRGCVWLVVEVRERRRIGSRLVGSDSVLEPCHPHDLMRGVVNACRDVVTAIDREAERRALLGDYGRKGRA